MKKMTKKFRILLSLATIIVLAAAMTQAVFAVNTPVNGGTFTYDGTDIVADDYASLVEEISGMEPGDSLEITQEYVNGSDVETDWYLLNVNQTLEDAVAQNGGYSYKLVAGGNVIFDSDAVGGSDSPESKTGLELATDATEEFFHIDTLGPGESGETTLYVALDGESQPNAYEGKNGELELQYAVEETPEDEVIIEKTRRRTVNTGDQTNMIASVAVFGIALILLILAIRSYRKDRKGGDEA